MTIPDCEDRTVYCTFPPERINGGDVTLDNNPSEFYQKTDKCRWTKWFNTGKGSKGDEEYPAEIYAKYTWQVCPDPVDINARIVGTEKIVLKKNKGWVEKIINDHSWSNKTEYPSVLWCPEL